MLKFYFFFFWFKDGGRTKAYTVDVDACFDDVPVLVSNASESKKNNIKEWNRDDSTLSKKPISVKSVGMKIAQVFYGDKIVNLLNQQTRVNSWKTSKIRFKNQCIFLNNSDKLHIQTHNYCTCLDHFSCA